MEQEAILRQREFQQLLLKFRGINRAQKVAAPKMAKDEEDLYLRG